MEKILADISVSMSEFKKNPAAVLREAKRQPVAVLSHNKTAFYMVEPTVFETMLEELADRPLLAKAAQRLADRARAVEVDLDEL